MRWASGSGGWGWGGGALVQEQTFLGARVEKRTRWAVQDVDCVVVSRKQVAVVEFPAAPFLKLHEGLEFFKLHESRLFLPMKHSPTKLTVGSGVSPGCWHMKFGSTVEVLGLHSVVVLEKDVVVIAVVVFSVVGVLDVEVWGGVEGQLVMAKHFRVIGSKNIPVGQ